MSATYAGTLENYVTAENGARSSLFTVQRLTIAMNTQRFIVTALLFVFCTLISASAFAQSATDSSSDISMSLKGLHTITTKNLMKTAEMLTDELYEYRPTDDVRTAGQILAHVANAQFMFCSAAAGDENPSKVNYEETATTKADILAALQAGFAYCNGVYDSMTDAAGAEMKPLFGMEMAGSAIMAFNSAHNYEHYGNLVTYMRMNGIVPPSSM